MTSFTSFIYGNVPVYVETSTYGEIECIGVLSPSYSTGATDVLYWLDLDDLQIAKFATEFFEEIEQALVEYERDRADSGQFGLGA